MRLEDKLAYRLLKESNHRVLNQYELYFLIENLLNESSNKRLNEVDWRYWGGRIKGFGTDIFKGINNNPAERPELYDLKPHLPDDDVVDDASNYFKYAKNRVWDRGIGHWFKRFKWSPDLVRNGRLRADRLLRKVMNGEKLDPTEMTDINLIIGTAKSKVNDRMGAGAFAHQDVRSAFEGNPDLQQAMRRRFKDAGYTAISNEEENAASEEIRKSRKGSKGAQPDLKHTSKVSKSKSGSVTSRGSKDPVTDSRVSMIGLRRLARRQGMGKGKK